MKLENKDPAAVKAAWRRILRRLFSWPSLGFLALILTFGIWVTMAFLWLMGHRHHAQEESSITAAGRVLRMELHSGLFTRSLVETDMGYYPLLDAMSLRKGEAVTVHETPTGGRRLCDSEHRCARMLAHNIP